jgi:mannose-6-phosphate isomerase-like protein (cupin superfamily)
MKFTPRDLIKKLPLPATPKWPEGVWDIDAFKHGTMTLILYTPKGTDHQTTHDQDELYIVISGSGELVKGTERYTVQAGDSLFVPAGIHHRFENFTDDLAVWAIFWGPKGGENHP